MVRGLLMSNIHMFAVHIDAGAVPPRAKPHIIYGIILVVLGSEIAL